MTSTVALKCRRVKLWISAARAKKYARGLSVSIDANQINDQFFEQFSRILEPHKAGTVPVNVYYQRADARARLTLGTEWRVTPSDTLIDDLKQLLGKSQVELEFN